MLPATSNVMQPLPPPQAMITAAQVVVPMPGIVQSFQAVRSAPTGPAVENNTKGNGPAATPSAPANQNIAAAAEAFTVPPIPAALNATGSVSPLFLAQLLGQNPSPAAQNLLADYEAMIVISQVKYKPSNATLPLPPNPGDSFKSILNEDAPLTQKLASAQAQAMQAQQANENNVRPSASIFAPVARVESSSGERREARRPENAAPGKLQKSLLSDPGVQAYHATATRNVLHLEAAESVNTLG